MLETSAPDYQTKNMNSLRMARTAKELRGIVEKIVGTVQAINIPEIAAPVISLSSISKKQNQLGAPTDFDKIDIRSLKQKEQWFEQSRSLSQTIAELGVAYQIMRSRTFASFKNQEGAARQLLTVIEHAIDMRNNAVKQISIDVRSGAPTEHRILAAQLANYLSTILSKDQYESITMRTFIASTDPIAYQTFICPSDLKNDEGTLYPEFSIVLTTKLDIDRKAVQHYVTSVADSKIPNTFDVGRPVDGLATAKKRVNSLLQSDGFLNWGNTAPKGAGAQRIQAVRMRDQFMNVYIDPYIATSTDAHARDDILREIVALASAVLLGRGSRLDYKYKVTKTGKPLIQILLNVVPTRDKVQRLITLFELSPKRAASFLESYAHEYSNTGA